MTRDQLRVADYLGHILEAIERIGEYTEDVDEVGFFGNKMIRMRSCATLRSSGKPQETLSALPLTLPLSIPKLPGRLSTPCATASRMVISRSILKSSGEPFNETCRNWRMRLAK